MGPKLTGSSPTSKISGPKETYVKLSSKILDKEDIRAETIADEYESGIPIRYSMGKEEEEVVEFETEETPKRTFNMVYKVKIERKY